MKVLHIATIVTGLGECLLFAGMIFGWPFLDFVLIRSGYFN